MMCERLNQSGRGLLLANSKCGIGTSLIEFQVHSYMGVYSGMANEEA